MNPSQGLYGGIGIAVAKRCYTYILLRSPHLFKSHTQTLKLKD